MLIGICGTSYSGKREVARYLEIQGFKRINLRESPSGAVTPSLDVLNNAQDINFLERQHKRYRTDNNGDSGAAIASVYPATPVQDEPYTLKHNRSSTQESAGLELPLTFDSADDMLNFVTVRWQEKFVTTDILNTKVYDKFSTRPFFLLVAIQAPITIRYERYKSKAMCENNEIMSLEAFVKKYDNDMYTGSSLLSSLLFKARLQIVNAVQSIELLYVKLSNLNLCDESRLRPSWDSYFMELASLAARRSNCMKRQVGCVLVRANRVIATGYNGTPRGTVNCNKGGCVRCNSGGTDGSNLGTCLCLHAEENALMEAGRERVGDSAVLYCNTCPCLTCSIKIVQMGLREVVYSKSYSMDEKSFRVLNSGGVNIRQYSAPEEGVVII
ncbi:cytidine deaminase-like protein [Dipodascopsis uninucleata]